MKRILVPALITSSLFLIGCAEQDPPPPPADIVMLRGIVITVDDNDSLAEAIAITDGRIVAVGSDEDIVRYQGDGTRTIDLSGRTVTPGLIDTHNHFAWGASDELYTLDLVYPAVESIEEVAGLVEYSLLEQDPGEWIVGSGWDAGKLTDNRLILASDLDAVSPDNPVWLGNASGHFGVANSAAMALAGIDRNTDVPKGGVMQLDEDGNPNGIFADQAQSLLYDIVPAYTADMYAAAIIETAPKLNAEGITTIKDPEVRQGMWDGYVEAKTSDQLPLRVFALWRTPDTIEGAEEMLEKIRESTRPYTGDHDRHLISGGVKIYIDGSGVVRTAWMHDEWNKDLDEVDRGNTGLPVVDPEILKQQVRMYHDAGIHLGVHAIGDRAIDFIVDTYAEVLEDNPVKGMRHSIIHCNIPTDHAIDTMARLQRDFDAGFPESQPGFLWWIGDAYAGNFGPERNQRMMPFGTYIKKGVRWGASSDFNVTPYAPRYGIWASVARSALLGTYGEQPYGTDESISVQDALKSYTRWNARQVFMEDDIGTIEVGKLADLVVWDRNPYTIPTEELQEMQAELTLLGGEIVFDKAAGSNP